MVPTWGSLKGTAATGADLGKGEVFKTEATERVDVLADIYRGALDNGETDGALQVTLDLVAIHLWIIPTLCKT